MAWFHEHCGLLSFLFSLSSLGGRTWSCLHRGQLRDFPSSEARASGVRQKSPPCVLLSLGSCQPVPVGSVLPSLLSWVTGIISLTTQLWVCASHTPWPQMLCHLQPLLILLEQRAGLLPAFSTTQSSLGSSYKWWINGRLGYLARGRETYRLIRLGY